jgi:hypothetical protein
MAQSTLIIENLKSPQVQSDLFLELKSLPFIKDIKVNLNEQEAWIKHSKMISASDIKLALDDAGIVSKILS